MADPNQTPTNESAPRSVGEDPAGMGDETSSFVLDAFEPMTSDLGEQVELPEVHQPPVEAAPDGAVVPTTPTVVPAVTQPSTPPVAPQAPTVPRPAEQPGLPQQAQVPTAPQAAIPQTTAPQAPVEQPQAAGPQPGDFGAIADGLKQSQDLFTKKLAEVEYVLSKEDKEAMGLDDTQAAHFATLAARVHVNAVGTVLRTISQQMPAMMSRFTQVQTAAKSAEDRFYDKWPQLKGHDSTVLQLANAYRVTNPRANEEEFTRMVGTWAVAALNLQTPQAPAALQTPQNLARTPGPVVRPNGTQPFVPARAANAPAANTQQVPSDPWAMGAAFIQADDSGHFDR